MEAVSPLTVRVLVCPAKMFAGLKEHDRLPGQARVMLPVKLLGPAAAIVKVVEPLPMRVVTFGDGEDIVNCATPVPDSTTD
jgi:hypothetical protein